MSFGGISFLLMETQMPLTVHDHNGFWGIRYPSETHLKLKSHEISFARNIFRSYLIVLKFCIEHGNDIAVLCAKF